MRFNVHNRFEIEVLRVGDRWVAYRLGTGTRRPDHDIDIPADTAAEDIATVLDDVFHEFADRDSSVVPTGPAEARVPGSRPPGK